VGSTAPARTHRKGEIVESLTTDNDAQPIKVNTLIEKGVHKRLDVDVYICNGKLWKKLKTGKFRGLVLQDKKTYPHYFLRGADLKKLTVNANKLMERLIYEEDIPVLVHAPTPIEVDDHPDQPTGDGFEGPAYMRAPAGAVEVLQTEAAEERRARKAAKEPDHLSAELQTPD
jgi:hypothetical protein